MLVKAPSHPSALPRAVGWGGGVAGLGSGHLAPTCDDPCLFLAPLVSGRKGLTWVDVLEQGLPDGVLQGACVLGGWEIFIG